MSIDARLWRDTAYFTVHGMPEAADIMNALEDFYAAHDPSDAIWDFSGGSLSALSADQFRDVARCGAKFAERRGPDARTAILVSSPAEVALVRAFSEMTASDTPIRFQAFENFEELEAWLFD